MPPTNLQNRRNQTAHPTLDGISLGLVFGASDLTDPDDLGVYLIRACRLTTPSCPVPGVGLGGLVPSPDIPVLGGLAPSPDIPVLGGLPLTSDDFRTHRAPLPSPSATTCPRRPRATFPQAPCTTYTPLTPVTVPHDPYDGHEAKPRSWMVIPHRAQTTARPPAVGSPPPRSARLGSTTSPGRRAPISSTPPLPTFSRSLRRFRHHCTLQHRTLTSKLQLPTFQTLF